MNKDLLQAKDNHLEHILSTYDYFDNLINNHKNVQLLSLKKCINHLITVMQPLLQNNNILIFNQCPEFHIKMCESEIMLVLLNILNNSFYELTKYKTLNKRYIFLDVQLKENSSIEIHIKDTRKTIITNAIFEHYSNTTDVKQNEDMRLFLSNKIVHESMNGELKVENCEFVFKNEPLNCTNFIVTLKEANHAEL